MQLAQPVLGTHPGDSGQSALNYLLAGHATIPPEMGIFLGQTWRLHPDICRFISEAVYDGRLRSHGSTASHRITTNGGLITKPAGILFVPVQHEGNSQCCDEETEVIEQLVRELLSCQLYDPGKGRTRNLTVDDVLIVAPFNMQVRALKKKLGAAAKIGSVDKFQGQEAHVVIVSMCSSTLEDSPRGAEFLLDPNRLNVAVSRAKTLAIVVGNPNLVAARCGSVREMELANLFCWLVEYSKNCDSNSAK
jgi:superfamily I DNA and/or RNA helicase